MDATNKDPLVWGRYVAVAGAYAACYELTRYFSFSHWMLPAGLRLACLLLVPRRFWPALGIGETLPVAEMAAMHAAAFGTLWAVIVSLPTIVMCMPAVALMQRYMGVRRANGQINMGFIMLATVVCALISASASSAALAMVQMGDGSVAPAVTVPIFQAWLLGSYMGALTLTPTIMALHERVTRLPDGVATFRAVARSPLTRDALFIAAPILILLMVLADQNSDNLLQGARLAMIVPVLVLTWRRGWHGSAVAGMFASIAMASTSFELGDPAFIQAQTVLAFAISTSLLFGVRVARRRDAAKESLVRATPSGPSPHR